MELVIELPQEIGPALVIVLTAILLDVLLGLMVHIKAGDFDVRLLPKFLLTGVVPYVGGLFILAIAAQYVGVVYREIFLSVAGLIGIKYVAELKDKVMKLIGNT